MNWTIFFCFLIAICATIPAVYYHLTNPDGSMVNWLKELRYRILFHVFLWSGSKLFPVVSVYVPDGEDGFVKAVHFAKSEQDLENSFRDADLEP